MRSWLVSDIWVKRTVLPSLEPETGLVSIGNFELPGVENYFWLAGDAYCGDRLASYGSALTFRVTWVVMRGDTSGTPTQGPDVVILGNNGLKLGFGENWYQQNNISLTVQLEEQGWYHLVSDEADDVITSNRFGFKGAPVTRAQFLSVLADVKHILLRAKFHTDQAEAR
ncbi:hypothetical protein LSTR_LSTR016604 [Laodelphax striatellus]|uniref:Laminin IV type A domain-containing protein n=1 Tax=Laodelphax striatellus TaxID=195883 RepID=A0A482XQP3_LAOST|nr:hypothetical protein LSTR_LSTR016604 [Laodelphax striatellus]